MQSIFDGILYMLTQKDITVFVSRSADDALILIRATRKNRLCNPHREPAFYKHAVDDVYWLRLSVYICQHMVYNRC